MMRVRDIQSELNLEVAAGINGLDREITSGYCGDLLSDVMANAGRGEIWLTIQSHQNILAVAVLKELAAIVLVNGHRPDEDTKARADKEGIPVLLSPGSSFELAGRLFSAGIKKKKE
jgi:serine kinase of HPr protein (carbohydrate metabolism regulator)